MQIEKRAAHEDAMNVVPIDDAGSEENVHTAKDQYCVDNEKFIDIQGITGSILEAFCTDKQDNPNNGLVSKDLQEEGVHIIEEDLEISPKLSQCRKSLQTYQEQTRYLQDINEKLMVANKRLHEDLEDKETEYQKLLILSKDVLREKRAIQK